MFGATWNCLFIFTETDQADIHLIVHWIKLFSISTSPLSFSYAIYVQSSRNHNREEYLWLHQKYRIAQKRDQYGTLVGWKSGFNRLTGRALSKNLFVAFKKYQIEKGSPRITWKYGWLNTGFPMPRFLSFAVYKCVTETLYTGPGETCSTIFHVIVRVAFYFPIECIIYCRSSFYFIYYPIIYDDGGLSLISFPFSLLKSVSTICRICDKIWPITRTGYAFSLYRVWLK